MTKVITTIKDLQAAISGKKVGTVFTMGALHAGHAELMRVIRQEIGSDGILVVTVFVNPTQFNDKRDLEKYPRDLASDIAFCERQFVDIVFAPEVSEVYPTDKNVVSINPGELGKILEGESRPGHFAGMATVVNRLLEITKPVVTCFGEKDYQQLAIVREMIKELELSVKVIGVQTVREKDGLAMSSRNQRLTPAQRELAPNLYAAMQIVIRNLQSGKSISESINLAKDWLCSFKEFELDYLTVLSPELSEPRPGLARILIAAKIGDVRLIDNTECVLEATNV